MNRRYGRTRVKQGGATPKSHYATTFYPFVSAIKSEEHWISQEGDRCDNLAYKFYGDASWWWVIAHVNGLTTNNIKAGTELRIPTPNQIKGITGI